MRAGARYGGTGDPARADFAWLDPRPILLIFLVAMVIRLVPFGLLVSTPYRFIYGRDSIEYDRLAQNLVSNWSFSLATSPPYTPDISRTPVFPAFLAGIYGLVGHSLSAAILVNILASSVVCVFVYLLGERMYGRGVGTFAGLALAFDATSVAYANQLMTEALFTAILLMAMLYLWRYFTELSVRCAVISGALLGAAALTRPIGALLVIFLGPVFLAVALRRTSLLLAMRDYAAFALCAMLLVGAWIGRNYAVAGSTDLTSIVAVNAYYHRAAAILAAKEGIPVEAMREEMRVAFDREFPSDRASLVERLTVMKRRAREIIRADIGLYVRLHVEAVGRMLGAEDLGLLVPPRSEYRQDRPVAPGLGKPMVRLAKGAMEIIMYLFAIMGAIWTFRQRTSAPLFLLLSVLGYFLVLSGPEAYSRFQVPVVPFIGILAGAGAAGLWHRLGSQVARPVCE